MPATPMRAGVGRRLQLSDRSAWPPQSEAHRPAVPHGPAAIGDTSGERLARTARLLEDRGYAVAPDRLAELCLGGPASALEVRRAAAVGLLELREDLALPAASRLAAAAVATRARRHAAESACYRAEAGRFAAGLVRWLPFIRSVAIAGSLASGGFVETDDVDLNLVVAPGHRHIAYVVVNFLGYLHALRHRGKPVDGSSQRPLAPRVMTVNLILEEGATPLQRDDEQMGLELLLSRPLAGRAVARRVVLGTPRLLLHFPQLAERDSEAVEEPRARLPAWLFPSLVDGAARVAGEAAWRWLQWTRRDRPEALDRVAFVRQTMRPYTLFDHAR